MEILSLWTHLLLTNLATKTQPGSSYIRHLPSSARLGAPWDQLKSTIFRVCIRWSTTAGWSWRNSFSPSPWPFSICSKSWPSRQVRHREDNASTTSVSWWDSASFKKMLPFLQVHSHSSYDQRISATSSARNAQVDPRNAKKETGSDESQSQKSARKMFHDKVTFENFINVEIWIFAFLCKIYIKIHKNDLSVRYLTKLTVTWSLPSEVSSRTNFSLQPFSKLPNDSL